MRDEYDFSKGERGKFYNANEKHHLPVYLDTEVVDYFTEKAKAKGVALDIMVNDVLKKDIALIEGIE